MDSISKEIYYVAEKVRNILNAERKDMEEREIINLIETIVFCSDRWAYRKSSYNSRLISCVYYSLRKDLSILHPYLEDEDITEIMVNGTDNIYIEKGGEIIKTDYSFYTGTELEELIRRIAAGMHREFNELNPVLDARLADGSRVNGVYKNIAIGGPALTIRKFPKTPLDMNVLVSNGTITKEAAAFLKSCVLAGLNIFISGGTSSGKTTFLNCLSEYIPPDERIVTIEDSLELQIKNHNNIVRLECRNANIQGRGEITMTDLIRTSLRMRPDRIIVGEVRGKEVMDMISACNTGHDGSMSTGHGNSVEGMLKRLESMYLQGADIPVSAIRAQISEGIDIMVHLSRLPDASRKVLEICQVCPLKDNDFNTEMLFEYINGKLIKRKEGKVDDHKFRIRGVRCEY